MKVKMKISIMLTGYFCIVFSGLSRSYGSDWTIVPGIRAGNIRKDTSEDDLRKLYGSDNVKSSEIVLEGTESMPGTIIYPGDKSKTLEILWKDAKTRKEPKTIFIIGNKTLWKTDKGISLGTSLRRIEEINKRPFTLSGFGWDWGGSIESFLGGELKELNISFGFGGEALFLQLAYDGSKSDVLTPEEYRSVSGEKSIRSDLPAMRKLNPAVHYMRTGFLGQHTLEFPEVYQVAEKCIKENNIDASHYFFSSANHNEREDEWTMRWKGVPSAKGNWFLIRVHRDKPTVLERGE